MKALLRSALVALLISAGYAAVNTGDLHKSAGPLMPPCCKPPAIK